MIIILVYNHSNTLNLSKIFSEDAKIFYLGTWSSSSEKEVLHISPQKEKEILNLVKAPIYYKESTTSFIGDVEVITIRVLPSNNNLEDDYTYEISNTGKIAITNLNKNKSSFYLMERYPAIKDNKNSSEKELYSNLKKIINENK